MKLQAVMENLQRQQRARLQQEMEARQQQDQPQGNPLPLPAPNPTAMLSAPGITALPRGRSQDPPLSEEGGEPDTARIQRAQIAALAAMRAAAAGLRQSSSPVGSEESHSSEEEEELVGEEEEEEEEEEEDGEYPREIGSEEEDMKGKWVEDFEEDLGEEEEEEYEEEEEMVEGELGSSAVATSSPGTPFLHKQQTPQQYRGEPSRLVGGQERGHSGVPQQSLSQLQPQVLDHGDWTYEEQFKQVRCKNIFSSYL
uniref:Uncharacterized protein n=2 Tax=Micrurus lemniscatus lemniscatus TaxID=129467 RepID=A0A2D4GZ66_MICLE